MPLVVAVALVGPASAYLAMTPRFFVWWLFPVGWYLVAAVAIRRTKVLRELEKIKLTWPELKYSTAKGVLILHPSTPVIAPVDHRQLAS